MPMHMSDDVFNWFLRALPALFDGGHCPRCNEALALNKQLVMQIWDVTGGQNVKVSMAPAARVSCNWCGAIHFFDLGTIQKRYAEAKANPGEIIPFDRPKPV